MMIQLSRSVAFLSKFGAAFKRPETWAAIVSSSLLVTVVDKGFDRFFAAQDQREEAVRRAADRVRAEADAFPSFASNYAIAITRDGKIDVDAQQKLNTNLISQKLALDNAIPFIPADGMSSAVAYDKALQLFSLELNKIDGIESMKAFWERASDLLVARRDLFRTLEPLRS